MSIHTEEMNLQTVGIAKGDQPFEQEHEQLRSRKIASRAFHHVCFGSVLVSLLVLASLLLHVGSEGIAWLDWQFIDNFPSRFPERAGIKSAIWGSVWLLGLTLLFCVPVGVGAAIYLEELMPRNRLRKIIEINIANLASVPSIVYGILGLALFVRFLGLERSVLAGALTLSILILPVVIIAAREALLAVPSSLRHAALAVGATKWQTVWAHILPAATPGILTGVILAISRAIGETAPLILIGALTFIAFVPEHPMDSFTALPIQIFNWASRPQPEFHELAAAGIIVLLGVLLSVNALAILVRNHYQRKGVCRLL